MSRNTAANTTTTKSITDVSCMCYSRVLSPTVRQGEGTDWQFDTADGNALIERRHNPGRFELSEDVAVFVHPRASKREDLRHRDDVAFHAGDFLNADNASATVLATLNLDHDVDCGGNLRTQRPNRKCNACHRHHRLNAAQCISCRVCVYSRQGTVMAGVHGLEHVEGFSAAHLADNDTIRPHSQAVSEQFTLRDFTFSLNVWRARLQSHDMGLLELKFRR